MPSSAPQSGNYSNDLLAMSFGASPAPPVGSVNNAPSASGEPKLPDPFNMQAISQAMPRAGLSATSIPPSQPTPNMSEPQQFPSPATFPFAISGNAPTLASQPPSQQPHVQPQHHPQTLLNGPTMVKNARQLQQPSQTPSTAPFATTSNAPTPQQHPPMAVHHNQQALPLPSIMNTPFSMANNNTPVPPSQPMRQHQQSQTMMKGSVVNQPPASVMSAQGGNFPANYQQPPQQPQPWNNTAFAPSGFQAIQPMPGLPAQSNSTSGSPAAVATNPMMMQQAAAAPPYHQGAMQQTMGMNPNLYSQTPGAMNQHASANVQKKL